MAQGRRWARQFILLITGIFIPVMAYPQAAAEYGLAAGKATTLGAQAGSSMRSATRFNPRQPALRRTLKIPPPPTKNLETVMEENRQRLAERSKSSSGGVLSVDSNPPKATVSVDGEPVGISPIDLTLPEGRHLIELSHPRYDLWTMEVTVSPNESTAVTAQLETKYKSTITLSIR